MTSTLRILNGLSYVALLLLVLSGLLLFSEGFRFGLVMIAVPGILMAMRMAKTIVKSGLAIGVVLFGLGLLEIHYGIARTMPVSWAVGCAGGVIWLLYKVIRGLVAWFMAIYEQCPKGGFTSPEMMGSSANFEQVYQGNGFSGKAASGNAQTHDDFGDGLSSYQRMYGVHVDGPNPDISEDNPNGKVF